MDGAHRPALRGRNRQGQQSGLGREAGTFGLEEFLEVKSLQL